VTATIGYDPVRIATLKRLTLAAIDDLRSIRCSDPDAAASLTAVRGIRSTLVDIVMPAIVEIERHDPLVQMFGRIGGLRAEWGATHRWLGDGDPIPPHIREMTDDELIAGVRDLAETWPVGFDGKYAVDLDRLRGLFVVDAAREVSRRANADPSFAEQLIESAGGSDSLGVIASIGYLRPDLVAEVTQRLVRRPPSGPTEADHDRRGLVLSRLLARVSRSPTVSQDLLGDDIIQLELVDRHDLDGDIVADFVAMATVGAALEDPGRRSESRDRVFDFRRWSDRASFPSGLSRGLALGLGPIANDLARTLDRGNALLDERGDPLIHRAERVRYDELAQLVGRIGADETARATLMSIAAHDLERNVRSGIDLQLELDRSPAAFPSGLRVQVEPSVRLIELFFVDAVAIEQARLDALYERGRAANAEAFDVVTSVVSLLPAGRPAVRVVKAGLAVGTAMNAAGDDDHQRVPESRVPAEADGIVAKTVLRQAAEHPDSWDAMGLDRLSSAGRDRLRAFAAESEEVSALSRDGLVAALGLGDIDAAIVRRFLAGVTGTDEAIDLAE
jgi:hypothetical protein